MAGGSRSRERRWGAAAAAVLLVTFGVQLALAGWNRSGETARLALTEASLELPWTGPTDEGEALFLRLDPEAPELTLEELAPLGFPVEEMARADGADSKLDPLPRSVWMVIDATPEAWRRYLEHREGEIERMKRADVAEHSVKAHQSGLATLRRGPPRVVISAVGTDPDELRRRHPDRERQVIVPGSVDPRRHWYGESWRGEPRPAVAVVVVPPALHRTVRRLASERERRRRADPDGDAFEPPYRAVVAWGRRHDPWLAAFEPRQGSRPAAPAAKRDATEDEAPARRASPSAGAR